MITTSGPAFLPPIVARGHSTTEKEMKMDRLTGTVKIYGTNLYSGCGHEAVKSFDSCPRCRIEELEDGVCLRQAKHIIELEAKLDRVRGWAWELHDSLKLHQCGDGCNGCPVCRIPDEACDLQSALGDEAQNEKQSTE